MFSYIYIYIEIHIQKYMVPKPFKKYYDGKCSHSTCQRHCITQIRPNDQNKQRREKGSKPKAVILVPTPTNSVLKYLTLLLQHPSKLKYFRC